MVVALPLPEYIPGTNVMSGCGILSTLKSWKQKCCANLLFSVNCAYLMKTSRNTQAHKSC